MYYSTTNPTTYPITYQQVKAARRLTDDDEREFIIDLMDRATSYAEAYMSICLVERTVIASYYDGDALELPVVPLIEITSVSGDVPYDLYRSGNVVRFLPKASVVYPLTITYQAGYEVIPASIASGINSHVSRMHANRDTTIEMDDIHRIYDLYTTKIVVG